MQAWDFDDSLIGMSRTRDDFEVGLLIQDAALELVPMEIAGDRNPRPLAFEPVQKKCQFSKKHEKSSVSSNTIGFVEVYVQDVDAERKRDLRVFVTSNHSSGLSLEVYRYLRKETFPRNNCMLNRADVEIKIGSRLKESGLDSAAHSHQIVEVIS